MGRRDVDQIVDCLHRVAEFREWVRHNHLFPTVPDEIVNPLLLQLGVTEKAILAVLYDYDALDRALAVRKLVT